MHRALNKIRSMRLALYSVEGLCKAWCFGMYRYVLAIFTPLKTLSRSGRVVGGVVTGATTLPGVLECHGAAGFPGWGVGITAGGACDFPAFGASLRSRILLDGIPGCL